ncbi:response regulator [candidate division KSB1 bacterium]|nr:response regulator [candidate division KSB1 bacterium]
MSKAKILVVDDEEDILELLRYNLSREGHQVVTATSGEQALKIVNDSSPDAVILDLMLPGVDGLDLCRTLKSNVETVNIPIIMLTAKDGEADIVTGLELGADDYITKPFSPRVVLARLKAVLRRASSPEITGSTLQFGPLVILPDKHEVRVSGQSVDLTATEFRILQMICRRPGWVYSREQILEFAQGSNSEVTGRAVDVHMVSLRRKLGQAGDMVETVRGVGYRFRDLRHA